MAEDYGIKVSMDGYDVFSANDRQLTLKTGYTLLKVFASGTINLSAGWNTISHNLGYVPQFLTYTKNTNDSNKVYLGTASRLHALARADTSNLYIKQMGTSSVAYYYIFYEQT